MKSVLLNDLCCRLPHGVLLRLPDGSIKKLVISKINPEKEIYLGEALKIDGIIPILYPLSEVFLSDEENPIPIGKNWKNSKEIKRVVPILELAKKKVPDAVTHKISKNGNFVISTLRKIDKNKIPLSFNTFLNEFKTTVDGFDLCNKYHIDYHGLIDMGLAEKIKKSVRYKIIKSPYEIENEV